MIEPLQDFVLCRLVKRPENQAGMIALPDNAKSMDSVGRARVYAVGPGIMGIDEGDIILIGEGRVYFVLIEGNQHMLVPGKAIIGIDPDYRAPDGVTDEMTAKVSLQ